MDKLERYIEEHSRVGTEAENALLAELERLTNLRVIQPKMLSGRVQGAFLTLITKMLQPRLVLEIGTFTGYSALSIAAGLSEGERAGTGERVTGERVTGAGAGDGSGAGASAVGACTVEGVGTGAGAGAEIHTVEIDDELEDLARSFFARSVHGAKIRLHIGSALEVVPKLAKKLGRPFDMVFIDGDKREYPAYYKMLMGDVGPNPGPNENADADPNPGPNPDPNENADSRQTAAVTTNPAATPAAWPMVRPGTIILTDNVLWYGKVAEPDAVKQADRMSLGIIEFNRLVAQDPRVENVILPLRDGINLIRVK